jgi:hypothetical protein
LPSTVSPRIRISSFTSTSLSTGFGRRTTSCAVCPVILKRPWKAPGCCER